MRSELKHIGYLALASSFIMLGSCRSTDTDNTLGQGVSAVNINLLGTSFHDGDPGSSQASLGKNASGTYSVERHSVLITPSTFMAAELSSASETGLNTQAFLGKGPMAVIPGAPLGPGMAFRVIAYKQSGDYHTHQDYTVGQTPVPMMLDNGGTYTMVAYSYGSATLPPISSGEQDKLSVAQVNYNNIDRDFMYYQKPNYIPTELENRLDITLSHKTTLITTIIKSSGYGTIDNIASASITPHFTTGTIPLATGNIGGRGSVVDEALIFPGPFGNTTQTAAPVFVNADTGGVNAASFTANLTIGGVTKSVNLPNSFSIKPGWKKNLTILFSKCGAYVAAGVWREFMCHNLGADTSADAFKPAAAIHGAKYQWGHKPTNDAVSDNRYLTQTDDQNQDYNLGNNLPAGWTIRKTADVNTPEDDLWGSGKKTKMDPCPNGYRIPSWDEVKDIHAHNSTTSLGNDWGGSPTNYATGNMVGTGLFLPAAGSRRSTAGTLPGSTAERGQFGSYWTGTRQLAQYYSHAYIFVANDGGTNDGYPIEWGNGISVRCIKEN